MRPAAIPALLTLSLAPSLVGCDPGGSDEGTADGTTAGTTSGGGESSDATGTPGSSTSGGTGSSSESGSEGADASSSGGSPQGPIDHEFTGDYEVETFEVDGTESFVADVAMAIDDDGDVHIAFTDRPANGDWRLQYAYRPYGATDFQATTVSTTVSVPVELFIDTSGSACIVYTGRDPDIGSSDLTLSCVDAGGAWVDEVLDGLGGNPNDIRDLDVAVDLDGEPVIFFHGNMADPVIARRAAGEWSLEVLEPDDAIYRSAPSIAVDSDNEVHVALYGSVLTIDNDSDGVLYIAADGTRYLGENTGSGESDPVLDLVLLQDDGPVIGREDGTLFSILPGEDNTLHRTELPVAVSWLQMVYDAADDIAFRAWGDGTLGFDVRQGSEGDFTAFSDPSPDGGGQFADPFYANGQLHVAHWKGGGFPQIRYTVATPI